MLHLNCSVSVCITPPWIVSARKAGNISHELSIILHSYLFSRKCNTTLFSDKIKVSNVEESSQAHLVISPVQISQDFTPITFTVPG